jgi:hypothetical protein
MELKTFVNDGIFLGDGYYVIGGFSTTKIDGFKFSDFDSSLNERIHFLIENYIEKTAQIYFEDKIENAREKAHIDCARVIGDNLKIPVENNDIESLCDAVKNSDQIQKWLDDIRENVKNYEFPVASPYRTIHNQSIDMSEDSEEYKSATEYTDETTFEEFIEQVSIIEL